MSKSSLLSSAILAAGLTLSSTADAQEQDVQNFQIRTPQGQTITVPCDKLAEDGSLTADFLGTLDTSIHGYDGMNFFEMTEEERTPYREEAIEKNQSFNARYLSQIFEMPYRQYSGLETEAEKMEYVQKKLDSHGMTEDRVSQLVEVCNSLNHD